jgi:hypothetical protein
LDTTKIDNSIWSGRQKVSPSLAAFLYNIRP